MSDRSCRRDPREQRPLVMGTVVPGQDAAKPTIDLYINFEFDSAKLDNDGILMLKRLSSSRRMLDGKLSRRDP